MGNSNAKSKPRRRSRSAARADSGTIVIERPQDFAEGGSEGIADWLADQQSEGGAMSRSASNVGSLVECYFTWGGGGKEALLSGDFTDPPWEKRIPMKRSNSGNFSVTCPLSVGEHDFCFVVDGQRRIDHENHECRQAQHTPHPETNFVVVKESNCDFIEALEADMAETSERRTARGGQADSSRSGSPVGSYTQELPWPLPRGRVKPPGLPPVLINGILNADKLDHYDPNFMPEPKHVTLNHLYCLFIKDGCITLATTSRFRQKFISTVMYLPGRRE